MKIIKFLYSISQLYKKKYILKTWTIKYLWRFRIAYSLTRSNSFLPLCFLLIQIKMALEIPKPNKVAHVIVFGLGSRKPNSLSVQSLLNFLASYYSYFFIHFFSLITPKTSVKIHTKQSQLLLCNISNMQR